MDDLGITEPARNRVIALSYELLGLISFLTAGLTKCVHGRSAAVRQLLRLLASSILIFSGASSAPKSWLMMT
jgi:hypothetical protein